MAIIFPKEKKRLKLLFWIFGILVILAVLLSLNFVFKEEVPEPKATIKRPREVKINFEILQDPRLEKLQTFEEILPFEEEIGRENPFLPY